MPDEISVRDFALDSEAVAALAEATKALQHLDSSPPRIATLGALAQNLLRSESVASSRIEGFNLSHRRLARAAYQAGKGQRDQRAAQVLGNVEAMNQAIDLGTTAAALKVADVEGIHRTLLRFTADADIAGVIRTKQNWIGGNDYNPIAASYVPPPRGYIGGLTAYRQGEVSLWSTRFAQATARAAIKAERLADAIEERQSEWLDVLGQPRRDAAVRQLVSVLPQQPVIDVGVAQTLTGKSHVAIGRALRELEDAGILNRLNERKWGRVWECDQLLSLVDSFEKSVKSGRQPH